jgi:SpoVK/Ycf46/Vps4 family AAA+-type ATPase
MNILDKDESGLILLHGEPGCGKSSYIKYLIKECKDKHFVILSQDLLQNMDSFREFLLNQGSKSIIIIEDFENLVESRERVGSNLIISEFLNITDGIYGDLFRLKFILTFNTDVQTIDSALLRKGRLKCKYKFNKLKGERLKNIAKKIGITLSDSQIHNGLSLADLFNYNDDNGEKQKEVIKIGFNK